MAQKLKIEKIESDLNKFEEIKFQIQEEARGFIKAMKQTNHEILKHGLSSKGYNNVYSILLRKTKLFKENCLTDLTCFYDKYLVREILDQFTESEKLRKMEVKILAINSLILKSEGLRNKMREQVEDSVYSIESEELLDSIESLCIKDEITIKNVQEKIEVLKQKSLKKEIAA